MMGSESTVSVGNVFDRYWKYVVAAAQHDGGARLIKSRLFMNDFYQHLRYHLVRTVRQGGSMDGS
jgi:hypothetical protein